MQEREIKSYFKQQMRVILKRSAAEPNGFRAYFANRDPKDAEILGLLAITPVMSGKYRMRDRFPTPLEALAALSNSSRTEICREFRRGLKTCLKQLTASEQN